MTVSDSVTAQLWETFCAGGGAGLIREAVELVLQELIEAEAIEAIGAGRYERSEMRVTERNGHRSRLLATQAGDVELKIPKLRRGSFFPSMLEPRRPCSRRNPAEIDADSGPMRSVSASISEEDYVSGVDALSR